MVGRIRGGAGRTPRGRASIREHSRSRCPTGCTGTCSGCSRRCSPGSLRRAASDGAAGRTSASTPGGSTTRCSTPTAGCSDFRSTTGTRGPTAMVARAHARVPREPTSTRSTGIQTMPINTVFQLLADECAGPRSRSADADRADPGPAFSFWLSGELVNEAHGRVDDRAARRPQRTLGARHCSSSCGCRRGRSRTIRSSPGTTLGPVLRAHAATAGRCCRRRPSTPSAGHDTASAFVAAPLRGPDAAMLSSGTWSLLGLELDEPVLTDRGVRLQPHQRARRRRHDPPAGQRDGPVAGAGVPPPLERAGVAYDYEELLGSPQRPSATCRSSTPTTTACSPRATCRRGSPRPAARSVKRRPASPGEFVRSAILVSLACKYRLVLERLERVTGREIAIVHVIGGGARNELLCQLTAATARPAGARRPGRGDRARQRARPGACRRRARLAGRAARAWPLRSAHRRIFEPGHDGAIAEDELTAVPRRRPACTGPRSSALA